MTKTYPNPATWTAFEDVAARLAAVPPLAFAGGWTAVTCSRRGRDKAIPRV